MTVLIFFFFRNFLTVIGSYFTRIIYSYYKIMKQENLDAEVKASAPPPAYELA